jgi:hypothetical protein
MKFKHRYIQLLLKKRKVVLLESDQDENIFTS